MPTKIGILIVSLVAALMSAVAAAGSDGLWRDVDASTVTAPEQPDGGKAPDRYRLLQLDVARLKAHLNGVSGGATPGTAVRSGGAAIELPLPGGGMQAFRLVPSGVMPEALAARYPEIRSYSGVAVDDPTVRVRLDWSPAGLRAMITGSPDVILIEPTSQQQRALYRSYFRKDAKRLPWHEGEIRGDEGTSADPIARANAMAASALGGAVGSQRRIYRLAVAADSRYSQFFGGTVPQALAAIVEAVNRINGVYESELSIRFRLVARNDQIIFTDAAKDPFLGLHDEPLLLKNQQILDATLGANGYDIGHVFTLGSGGLAQLTSVCVAGSKAEGMTGSDDPQGDAFWVDFVAHEIGHQLGGNHTFNSPLGSCGGNNRAPNSAYEIGSGTTIMAYAGLCRSDDVMENSIPYFHVHSLDEISANVWSGSGSTCGAVQQTGNTPPWVDADTRATFVIPKKTPFFLEGDGEDPDGDALSFSWEQYDLGSHPATVLQTLAQIPRSGLQPLFRSFPPTRPGKTRMFPQLRSALHNLPWGAKFEVLPGYGRTLAFRLTARDGRGGVAASAVRTVYVANNAGPFTVLEPLEDDDWVGNTDEIVRWDVAGTRAEPIACERVDIELSTNGDRTFRYQLAEGAPNVGRLRVRPPRGLKSEEARIRVMCADNIFGAISSRFNLSPAPQ